MDVAMLASAFAAGALSFFSPCVIPLLPIYIGLLTVSSSNEANGFSRRIVNALAFVLGISTVFAIMGAGAGLAGSFITSPAVVVAFGVIVLICGLHMSGLITIPILMDDKAQLVEYFAVGGFPTSVFIDSQGNIIDVRVGVVEKEDLESILSSLK